MTEVVGYVVLAAVSGLVCGVLARQIRDDRKNREMVVWLHKRQQRGDQQ